MNQIMLEMPSKLHQQLVALATKNDQSVDQYILNLLTELITYQMQAVPLTEVAEQEAAFQALRQQLGPPATPETARQILYQTREPTEPEPELTPQLQQQFREKFCRIDPSAS